jgi:hypothetical protein
MFHFLLHTLSRLAKIFKHSLEPKDLSIELDQTVSTLRCSIAVSRYLCLIWSYV